MAEPRLVASLWVAALLRRVQAAGDFATVLHRGDATAGSVVLIERHRSGGQRALQRVNSGAVAVWRAAAANESVDSWIDNQRRYDPDLWVIELDTPDAARFIDEMIVSD